MTPSYFHVFPINLAYSIQIFGFFVIFLHTLILHIFNCALTFPPCTSLSLSTLFARNSVWSKFTKVVIYGIVKNTHNTKTKQFDTFSSQIHLPFNCFFHVLFSAIFAQCQSQIHRIIFTFTTKCTMHFAPHICEHKMC